MGELREKIKEKISIEVFHEHFKNLSDTAPSENHVPPECESEPNPFLNDPITMKELEDFLNSSSNGKASGPDHIKNEFLKQLSEEGLRFVLSFFNKILDIIVASWSLCY